MAELTLVVCSGANRKAPPGSRRGIVSVVRLDMAAVAVRVEAESREVPFPSFLAAAAGGDCVYVASELPKGDGRVSALRWSPAGFSVLNSASTAGNAAVHLCLDRQGKFLFAANYQADDTSGPVSVAAFALRPDGAIGDMTGSAAHAGRGPDALRQSRPHCHSVMISPDNRLLAAADLGTDSVYLYRFDAATGAIALARQVKLPPGCGPRHSVFHPSRPLLYVTGELDSTLMTVAYDPGNGNGQLAGTVAAIGRPPVRRNYPSGIAISPDGHYLLVANRGADTVAVFWIDPSTGLPQLRGETGCGGTFPRALRFDGAARHLAVANQKSGSIAIFGWDFAKGALTEKPLMRVKMQTPLDMIFVE
jgi:6-phosphogluconolactonase